MSTLTPEQRRHFVRLIREVLFDFDGEEIIIAQPMLVNNLAEALMQLIETELLGKVVSND